jgi:hypothetical protein
MHASATSHGVRTHDVSMRYIPLTLLLHVVVHTHTMHKHTTHAHHHMSPTVHTMLCITIMPWHWCSALHDVVVAMQVMRWCHYTLISAHVHVPTANRVLMQYAISSCHGIGDMHCMVSY